eukprot:scaffold4476_cov68-Cyclotella_meneghiniana.AAC.3
MSQLWPQVEMDELVAVLKKEDNGHYWSSGQDERNDATLAHLWRHQICDWYYEFVDNYNFDREVHSVCDDGTASRTKALRRLCCGHFADKAILATMEQDILETLEWFVNPPTLHGIALAFSQINPLRLVSAQDNLYVYEAARFQCELAVFLPNLLLKYRPSEIAFAAMQNAMEKTDPIVLTDKVKTQFNSLLHHPETKMDPSKVEEVKAYMKHALPEMEDDAGEEPQRRSIGDSPSPTNVTALVMVTECDEEC